MHKRTANFREIETCSVVVGKLVMPVVLGTAKGIDGSRVMRQIVKLALGLATVAVSCGNALAVDILQRDLRRPSRQSPRSGGFGAKR